jgi:hypothetical protein
MTSHRKFRLRNYHNLRANKQWNKECKVVFIIRSTAKFLTWCTPGKDHEVHGAPAPRQVDDERDQARHVAGTHAQLNGVEIGFLQLFCHLGPQVEHRPALEFDYPRLVLVEAPIICRPHEADRRLLHPGHGAAEKPVPEASSWVVLVRAEVTPHQ